MVVTLTATKRAETGKRVSALFKDGKIPAVVYGPKQDATPITLSAGEFEKVFRSAGESSVIELTGVEAAPLQVLVHDVDNDPVSHRPRHVDFYAIEKGAKVEVAVPLTFVGESTAVKAGNNLVKVMHELEIEAAPADLPHTIEVDISVLANVGDQIHVKDVKLPQGVVVNGIDGEEVIALIQEVQEEKEEAPAAIDMDSIEVEQKGKDEAPAEAVEETKE
ncbi:MAG TPA: 50S ribosomal protein L25 [Candidatus Paceibacterota bacterium]|nr:50S ribosomal protein L25 [Candidatus Paceibacterota bacterium]